MVFELSAFASYHQQPLSCTLYKIAECGFAAVLELFNEYLRPICIKLPGFLFINKLLIPAALFAAKSYNRPVIKDPLYEVR
jgi:hypothetical protein